MAFYSQTYLYMKQETHITYANYCKLLVNYGQLMTKGIPNLQLEWCDLTFICQMPPTTPSHDSLFAKHHGFVDKPGDGGNKWLACEKKTRTSLTCRCSLFWCWFGHGHTNAARNVPPIPTILQRQIQLLQQIWSGRIGWHPELIHS